MPNCWVAISSSYEGSISRTALLGMPHSAAPHHATRQSFQLGELAGLCFFIRNELKRGEVKPLPNATGLFGIWYAGGKTEIKINKSHCRKRVRGKKKPLAHQSSPCAVPMRPSCGNNLLLPCLSKTSSNTTSGSYGCSSLQARFLVHRRCALPVVLEARDPTQLSLGKLLCFGWSLPQLAGSTSGRPAVGPRVQEPRSPGVAVPVRIW